MAPTITYCTTHDDLIAATSSLALSSILVVDCEGRTIGMPDGGPSILTLSDISASHIFLIDVLALTSTVHPSLSALHRLFSDPSITKVFWDGRADVLELIEAYPGLSIAGVLDLQLVEVASRLPSYRETDAGRLWNFRRPGGYFNSLQQDIEANPALFDGIYRLGGLAHVVRTLGLANAAGAKDPTVVAMHQAQGSEIWMRRPLPKELLDYAAHDAVLIAAVYTRLMQEPWNKEPGKVESYMAQSERYVAMYPDRKLLAKHQDLDLKRFLPMGFLEDADSDGPRYSCSSCDLLLPLGCFLVRDAKDGGARNVGGMQRMTFCRLCHAVARAKRRGKRGEWVNL
ncbi:hypothetical protein GY45DRAFT_1363948 [Cubamyces sp. BRFM 1775]|nr:hypothetical protein GY45DRAFT_1363948 [Cubamyces sp. BRFM 1775]